ncbi:TPA: restriction endonuclease subunit S [Proteus mirabilis]|uniref:restriction endonuclease subunit S n=1 Tax=Proteus mirabilis TaxID=584 RepID=UPI001A2106B3|nr:restriction endonuclease subunit S [Proteus mirabilis]EKT9734402.1 restriction endonuclease subunit S [Proteus mirabilis]EKW6744484.1 restriction endonuclease subunit S [Proteus mirabilis]MBI6371429.1 restriction endonuclease subunit S [Proteus mirabilis]MCU6316170.1 restriction endonuclease subunit S [Proteus mirabilis]HCT9035517.1 restriction endonuclease subunit S [Proteus mirabilis]
MSKLSYLEKLLDGVEVEWLPLWKVTIWDKKFNAVDRKKQPKVINYQYLLAAELFKLEQKNGDVFLLSTGEKTGWTNEVLAGSYLREGEVVTIPWGKSRPVKDVIKYYKGRFVTADNRIATSNNTAVLLNKYLYYWMMHQSQLIDSYYRGSGIQHPSMADVLDMLIPIPSVAIQSEIVRILDKFTALTAELTAELTARKKQYNYYRDQLLNFAEGEVEHLPMGDKSIGEFIRGANIQKKDFEQTGVGCIHYGQIYTYYGTYTEATKTFISVSLAKKCRKAQTGNLVIATTSENDEDVCKAVAWLGDHDIAVSGDACIYKHNLNPKYVSYFFQTEQFQNQKKQYITGTKVRRVNADNLAKMLIPVPSPEEQARIVKILDKFDILTNSISEGLPHEIELRQKQYEYYRDLLFNFPKPVTN